VNYPFTDRVNRPYPAWDSVTMIMTDQKTRYHSLQAAFTKRFSDRWQASATYTLGGEWQFQPTPLNPGCSYPVTISASGRAVCDVPVTLAADLAEQWYRTGEQLHRLVFNGIWEVGYGFQLSGLYFFADNGRDQAVAGVDPRGTGNSVGRVRLDGTIIPWFGVERANLHRVDLRLQRHFQVARRLAIDGIVEVFNAFNHTNYGSYVTNELSPLFGQPTSNIGTAYQPRRMQLGFRATF
jgi:hypothetical protein